MNKLVLSLCNVATAKMLVALPVAVLLLVPATGCKKQKPDPTQLPTYKDMTNPANMPGMGRVPGKEPSKKK